MLMSYDLMKCSRVFENTTMTYLKEPLQCLRNISQYQKHIRMYA